MANEGVSGSRDPAVDRIVQNPRTTANFLKNPARVVEQLLPADEWFFRTSDARKQARVELETQAAQAIRNDPQANSVAVLYGVFDEAIKNPQRTFDWTLRLSRSVFGAGLLLMLVSVGYTLEGDRSTAESILAGVMGGSGVFASLGSLFTLSTDGVRKANVEHVRLRLVLHAFSDQIANIRSTTEGQPAESVAKTANKQIRDAMNNAVEALLKTTTEEPVGENLQSSR